MLECWVSDAVRLGSSAARRCRCGRETLPCLWSVDVVVAEDAVPLWAVALPCLAWRWERERRRTAGAHRTPQTAHPHTPAWLHPCLECLLRCYRLPSADRRADSRHLQELGFVLCWFVNFTVVLRCSCGHACLWALALDRGSGDWGGGRCQPVPGPWETENWAVSTEQADWPSTWQAGASTQLQCFG
jgi:hypothetical protein